ncbi:MAG: tyrosine-type recombinase/integrase [Lachnospiraceae bacterium]
MHNTTVIDNSSKGLTDELTPHSCRRTFSTRLSASGASETDLIALMGHTSIEVDRKHYINQEVKNSSTTLLLCLMTSVRITSKKSLPNNARKKRSMPKRLVS